MWKKCVFFLSPCSELLGGTVGHAFSHMHAYPPHSSWADNWTVLWRILTLKGNLSHLIIGIQHMLFICINTNKTHSLPAQREPTLKRKSYHKTSLFLRNWTKDYGKKKKNIVGGGIALYSLGPRMSYLKTDKYSGIYKHFLFVFWTWTIGEQCWTLMLTSSAESEAVVSTMGRIQNILNIDSFKKDCPVLEWRTRCFSRCNSSVDDIIDKFFNLLFMGLHDGFNLFHSSFSRGLLPLYHHTVAANVGSFISYADNGVFSKSPSLHYAGTCDKALLCRNTSPL